MPEHQNKTISAKATIAKLQVCFFSTQQQLCDAVRQLLDGTDYELQIFEDIVEIGNYIVANDEQIDCLVVNHDRLEPLFEQLRKANIVLPTVILSAESVSWDRESEAQLVASLTKAEVSSIYHQAEIRLYLTQIKEINSYISLAIKKFIRLNADESEENSIEPEQLVEQKSLIVQQRRLTDKLKERLGYLGFFYKRNPDQFWLNLPQKAQQKLTTQISLGYRRIILVYFDSDVETNKLIDEFVDRAFFADISTSQILEIHMELMDEFAHQLKIEGRNDDILLDYRLPLIDIISHLCEMYRRSIPGSEGWINLPFTLE